jgi:ABC-2 type transport system ATP-binding protein
MTSALSIKHLSKTYETGVRALGDVSLEVGTGDFFGLLGPNGAGKTTLIGIVSGLANKSGGEASVFGLDIDRDRDRSKSLIGLVPQEINFNIFEKPVNILVTQAGYYGIPRAEAIPRARKYLKLLGLWDKRGAAARTLSGGMKRRLMIARALVHEPKLLILDEPTAGVDIELRREMWDFLRELNTSGTTIILTTHYLEEAEQMCRNIAIIDKGDIVRQGSVKDLLGTLGAETFVFDLERPLAPEMEKLLGRFEVKKTDERTIEMLIKKGETLTEAVLALDRLDIRVRSMRNKSNRLEELFISLTGK